MKVLDTSVAIDHLRGLAPAVSLFERLLDDEAVWASEVVRFELLAGVREEERGRLERFFGTLRWISVDEDIARVAGALAARYRRARSGIDKVDYLIGATALVLNADLLTTNVRHFPMLPGLSAPY